MTTDYPNARNRLVLDRAVCLQYIFWRHHVVPGSQADSLDEAIDSLVGVHSARLPTPYVALHARVKNLKTSEFRNAVFEANRLIKLRCMRKTLHTVTQGLAPIVHNATLELRTGEIYRSLAREGLSEEICNRIVASLSRETRRRSMTHGDILSSISGLLRLSTISIESLNVKQLSRLILKLAWESGHLCYINKATSWQKESRYYGSTKELYPGLSLDAVPRKEAINELVLRHVDAYGPVSVDDIAWWAGIGKSKVLSAIEHQSAIVPVDVNGLADSLFMTTSSIGELEQFKERFNISPWCAFLAYEDPSLKGYYNTRLRYVNESDYNNLFNAIGEARASILISGIVAGTWSWNAREGRIYTKYFRSLTRREESLVKERRLALESFLDENSQLVLFR